MTALEILNISKRYDQKTVVDNFSLKVAKGETVALIGESGSGKSTILKMIAGFEKPDTGIISIHDNHVYSQEIFVEPEKRQISMVFPEHTLFPHLNAEKNIAFALHKKPKSEKRKITAEMLDLVGLSEFKKHKPHQLSSGQQQRISLARALAAKPQILLLDEPLSKLDIMLKKRMREQIKQIVSSTETTTILVTHDKEDAFAIAEKILIIKDGKMQQMGTSQDIYQNPVNEYVAHFFGHVNIIEGEHISQGYSTPLGFIKSLQQQPKCNILVRPENIDIDEKEGTPGTIVKIVFCGKEQEVTLELQNKQHLTLLLPKDQILEVGQRFFCKINTNNLMLWPK